MDRRISGIGGFILLVLTLAAGISVFVVMQRQAESLLSKSIGSLLQSNQRLFQSGIKQSLIDTQAAAARPGVIKNLQLLASKPDDPTAPVELQRIAQSFPSAIFTGLSFYDIRGHEVARTGYFSRKHDLRVPLKSNNHAFLLWDGQFILQASSDILDQQGRRIGMVKTEANLLHLTLAFGNTESIGKTSEFGVCAPLADDKRSMDCFLSRASGINFKRLPRVMAGERLPQDYALNGEAGVLDTKDYRREQVIAAYAPMGAFGLGMVMKITPVELYKPVTEQLKFIAPLLAALVMVGMLLLHVLVRPLVRKLIDSERVTRATSTLLRESEERLRLALDAAHMGTFDWDVPNNRITWSRWHEELWGYQPGEFSGTYEAFAQRVHPDDIPGINTEVTRCIAVREPFVREFRVVWPDASTHWIAAHGEFTFDSDGQPLHMRGAVVEITERKRAEALLTSEKRTLEMTAEDAPLSEILDAIARNVEAVSSDALCSILLLDADGIHLQHGAAPSLPEDYNRAIHGKAIGPQGGSCGTAVYRNQPVIVTDIATDPLWDNYRALALSHGLRACWSTPIRSANGRVLGSFALYYREPRGPGPADFEIISRMTHLSAIAIERNRAEEEIRQINLNLERRVLERTTELQAANQELEAFSYSVSHDLRAPLRSIDGFSQAVLEDCADKLDDQAKDYLNRVRGATQRMGHLIDDLLTLSRVTRTEMRRRTVDLSALAAEVIAELQNSEPKRRVNWQIEPGLIAEGDTQLLHVMLVNLLGNAWKFTGKTANAKIGFGTMRNAKGTRDFFVRDNGVGYDMAYAGKMFDAFQRLHLASEFPGTGVGLATVQRIVHRHGGRVWAEGTEGKGATFYFTL